jgi:competence protein ComEC
MQLSGTVAMQRSGAAWAPVAAWLRAWAAAERNSFALWLPVAMAGAILLDLTARYEPTRWFGAAIALGGLALAVLARRWLPVRWLGALVAAAGIGMASAQFATWRAAPILDLPRHATIVSGTVHLIEKLPEGVRVTLDAPRLDGGTSLARRLRIRLRRDDHAEIAPGDALELRALVSPPASPAYPGAWDLQRDAFFAGLGGYGFALGRATVTVSQAPSGPSLWLEELRAGIAHRVGAVLTGADGAIAATLLTGFTAAIPEADKVAFRDSGLAHLLAVAGLHIGIVMGWVLLVARVGFASWEWAALRWPTKQIAVLIALAAGGFYMLLTGSHVPIVRSFAMACLVAVAVLAGRRAVSLRGLALAATAIMLIAPNEVLGVSFQMSFSAVLALVGGYDLLRAPLNRLRGEGGPRGALLHIIGLLITSALAGTFSAPFAAYHFGRVQIYFVLANLVAVPITAFWVMPAGMIALLLMPLHLDALALYPMAWGIESILWIGRTVSALPAAVFAVSPPPAWGMLVLSLGIAWLGIWRTRLRWAGLLAIAIGIASPAFDRKPDILVSADGRMMAARTPEGAFAILHSGASHFTRDAWLQLWAAPQFLALPATGDLAGGRIACLQDACTLRRDPLGTIPPGPMATLLRGPTAQEDCDSDVLASLEPIRLRCGEWMPWVDRFDVWRDGAHAIWLDATGPRIVSDRDFRGVRPWVPRPPVPRGKQPRPS